MALLDNEEATVKRLYREMTNTVCSRKIPATPDLYQESFDFGKSNWFNPTVLGSTLPVVKPINPEHE